jgi:G3E family GTPase
MQRRGAFDHILLETTGLADPGAFLKYSDTRHQMDLSGVGPIASMFWMNEEFAIGLGKDICLDGVVCVVDAVFGEKVGVPLLCSRLSNRDQTATANGRRSRG